MSNRKFTKIVVHCSDTPATADVGAEDIRRWHTLPPPRGRGWKDIGYHYVVRRDGTVELGRDTDRDGSSLDEVGAHAAGHNTNSIGICLVGGKGGFNFTFRQLTQLIQLIEDLREEIPTIEDVVGHRDLNAGKDCPQFDVRSLLKGL